MNYVNPASMKNTKKSMAYDPTDQKHIVPPQKISAKVLCSMVIVALALACFNT